jgi:hypothetical protein
MVKKTDELIEKLMPRPRTVVSTALIIAGMSIPALGSFGLLTFTILLGLASFALVATGGVLTLIFWGEI